MILKISLVVAQIALINQEFSRGLLTILTIVGYLTF